MLFNWSTSNKRLTKAQIAEMVEDYANNPNTPLVILSRKYQVSEQTVGKYITDVLFGGPVKKDPVVITLQSKINEDITIEETTNELH